MNWLLDPNAWIGLLTLTALSVVLSVDNIIFISLLASKLPKHEQARGRQLGLVGAFVTRLLLLFSIAWIVRLTAPLFTVFGVVISGRGLILLAGGLFLIAKATFEIHGKLEGEDAESVQPRPVATLASVVTQIMIIDIVFSLDSVITAIGMADKISVMVIANVLALGVMLWASAPISAFVDQHPTVKVLALSFLVLIGTNLVAEGLGREIPKGYTYFAMFFAFSVELLNLRLRARHTPAVRLHQTPRLES
jgi:predicted tellurium resistance membrane protein TerC